MMCSKWSLRLFGLVCLIYISSCSTDMSPVDATGNYVYQTPPQTEDGWNTTSLSSVHMHERPLTNLMNRLNRTTDHRIHSLLIIKDGKLVFEEYFPGDKFNLAQYTGEAGFTRDDTHNLCSATKSITSALIGICIDAGFIESVDEAIFNYFTEHQEVIVSEPEKGSITLENLLTMTSGLEWDDETYSYFDSRNDMYQLFNSSDPVRYMLTKPLIETPGMVFAYRNCNTNILGEIIYKASDLKADVFSGIYLFNKLGISEYEWQSLPNHVVFCSGDLRLRPRDMAKFGYVFLSEGLWKGERIISSEWISVSTYRHITLNQNWADLDGYGYQWWLWDNIGATHFSAYAASGWGGQWIIVAPELNIVIVTTGGNYYSPEVISIEEILVNYLLPSL